MKNGAVNTARGNVIPETVGVGNCPDTTVGRATVATFSRVGGRRRRVRQLRKDGLFPVSVVRNHDQQCSGTWFVECRIKWERC